MALLLKILLIVLIVIAVFFVLTFTVYIFNLDMKLTTSMQPLLEKHYDKRKRQRNI